MGLPAGSRPKGKEKEKPKIRNLRRYIIGGDLGGLPAGSRPKDKGKERRKTKNQNFEAGLNRRGPWGPPAGSRPKEKEREGQITTGICRGLCVHGGFGASSRAAGQKTKEKRERKAKNQKCEAV